MVKHLMPDNKIRHQLIIFQGLFRVQILKHGETQIFQLNTLVLALSRFLRLRSSGDPQQFFKPRQHLRSRLLKPQRISALNEEENAAPSLNSLHNLSRAGKARRHRSLFPCCVVPTSRRGSDLKHVAPSLRDQRSRQFAASQRLQTNMAANPTRPRFYSCTRANKSWWVTVPEVPYSLSST